MKSNSGRSALLTMSLICIFLLAACGSSTPVLRYITISPSGSTIATGTTLQYTATGYYSNGAITPGITVSWSSSNTAVASINGTTGVAAGLTAGTTTITATALGITSGTTTLTVAGLTSIAVTPATTTISIAATQQYDAVATYTTSTGTTGTEDVTAQATWTSSSPAVATFSATTPGLATGVAAGTTTVTAAIGAVTGTATLNVTAATSLKVTPATATINVGGTVALTVVEVLANGTTQPPTSTVTWSSATPSQANVVANGTGGAIVAAFATSGTTPVVTPVAITATEGTLSATANITVVTGSTHYAYVANSGSNSISSYTVSAGTTPYLTPLATTNQNVTAFTFLNPDGMYLYEIDQSSNIWVYNVTASSGVITQATGITQPQLAGQQGDNFGAVDPYGRFVYVVDDGIASSTYPQGTLYGFTVNPTTGALTPIAAVTAYTTNLNVPQSIAFDHTGSYLYVTNYGNGTTAGNVSAYSIDPTTGNLTPLSTPTYAAGIGPVYSTIDPTGTYLYVPNSGDTPNTVSAFSIGAGGALTPLAAPKLTVTGAAAVINVAVSPNGSYLYVLDAGSGGANGQVFAYTLAAGAPSTNPISGTPIATGLSPTGMAIDPTSSLLAVDNVGTSTTPSTISLFTIGSTGALTSQTPVATQDSPRFIVFYNEQP
jgi:6-phosphogluconolactonase (cycloisomerase 2 family)